MRNCCGVSSILRLRPKRLPILSSFSSRAISVSLRRVRADKDDSSSSKRELSSSLSACIALAGANAAGCDPFPTTAGLTAGPAGTTPLGLTSAGFPAGMFVSARAATSALAPLVSLTVPVVATFCPPCCARCSLIIFNLATLDAAAPGNVMPRALPTALTSSLVSFPPASTLAIKSCAFWIDVAMPASNCRFAAMLSGAVSTNGLPDLSVAACIMSMSSALGVAAFGFLSMPAVVSTSLITSPCLVSSASSRLALRDSLAPVTAPIPKPARPSSAPWPTTPRIVGTSKPSRCWARFCANCSWPPCKLSEKNSLPPVIAPCLSAPRLAAISASLRAAAATATSVAVFLAASPATRAASSLATWPMIFLDNSRAMIGSAPL